MAAYGPQFLLGSTFVGRDCQKDNVAYWLQVWYNIDVEMAVK